MEMLINTKTQDCDVCNILLKKVYENFFFFSKNGNITRLKTRRETPL